MTNIIQGPWLGGAVIKPYRRLSRQERAIFNRWLDWLARHYAEALTRGSHQVKAFQALASRRMDMHLEWREACLGLGIPDNEAGLVTAGVAAASPEWINDAQEPERPRVWPDTFHIANIVDKLAMADHLSRTVEAQLSLMSDDGRH